MLSHDEEITLRRVHSGIAKASALVSHNLDRLISIGLVIRRGSDVVLTDAGRNRLRNLPSYDQKLSKLVEMLTNAAR